MIIIGVDFHPEFQQIASVDTDTGEFEERRVVHCEEAEKFYRAVAASGKKVRVGMEASGSVNHLDAAESLQVIAGEEIKKQIAEAGINRCARESGFDRKNFIRKLVRGLPVKRNSYNEFVRRLSNYASAH